MSSGRAPNAPAVPQPLPNCDPPAQTRSPASKQPTASADILAVFGASGSGKSLYVKSIIADERRLIVFDSMDEYRGVLKVRTAAALLAAVRQPAFRVAFVPAAADALRIKAFAFVCNVAFALGDCCLVVEELRFVTKPSWAPMEGARITAQGRHKRLRVRGTSQRPASVDKDFMGNCTAVRSGRLAYPDDARAVARVLLVPESDLLALRPLEWIERDLSTGEIKKGVLHPGNPM